MSEGLGLNSTPRSSAGSVVGMMIDVPADMSLEVRVSVQAAMTKAVSVVGIELLQDADRLAAVIMGVATPSLDLVKERIERRKAINHLTKATEWLTAAQILEGTTRNARTVADWKRRGRIFGVQGPDGSDLYPAYQFDAALTPLPVIAAVLKHLGSGDPWQWVGWFHSPNGWLACSEGGERRPQAPKDRLFDKEAVLHAASMHGQAYVA